MLQLKRPLEKVIVLFFSLICICVTAEELTLEPSDADFTNDLKERRERVFDSMNDNSILVLFSAKAKNRSNDVDWAYRQTNDLYYLTGSSYPDSYLVLIKEGSNQSEYFFHKQGDPKQVQWIGILPSTEQVKLDTGIKQVYPEAKFESFLQSTLNGGQFYPGERTREKNRPKHYDFYNKLIEGEATLWLSLGQNRKLSQEHVSPASLFAKKIASIFPEVSIQNISGPLEKLREIKSKFELIKLQQAIDITINAQKKAMHRVQTAQWEYQVQALIDYTFRDQGACCPSFPSITASGANTTILHYEHPTAKVDKEGLFLTDIGAEFDYYAADVTRTYPADGTFSDVQKEIYSAVLKAQKLGIKESKSGALINDIESVIAESLGEDLLKLGLIDTNERKQVYVYYAHGLGHSLGMDVHDTFTYHQKLRKNMVITIEPGIYVRKSKVLASPFYNALSDDRKKRIDKALQKYDGIGVRIEDDILISKGSAKVLSKNAPREIDEIEKWMAELN